MTRAGDAGPGPSEAEVTRHRIGIDLGGTKIEGIVLGPDGGERARERIAAPRDSYGATLDALAGLVGRLASAIGDDRTLPVGIGMPGSLSPGSGRVQNANSTWLNGQRFGHDLEARLGRPVRLANDANCFAISEATDGAGAGQRVVFGVILGTGCGGGIAVGGRVLDGPLGVTGEWGHNPLPWPRADEFPGPTCWCGRQGCMETWVSGTGLARDHHAVTGTLLTGEEILAKADAGDAAARATRDRHACRLARGLATVVNLIDPDVIVLGGGLSQAAHLYAVLPDLMAPHIFSDTPRVRILPPRWGSSSGVRGAAWLWS